MNIKLFNIDKENNKWMMIKELFIKLNIITHYTVGVDIDAA